MAQRKLIPGEVKELQKSDGHATYYTALEKM
jgi:hypothetical protein